VLDVAGDGTVVRFSLVDARGEVQLRRTLPTPGRGQPPADCLALADTIAVIVDRYLASITYQADETIAPLPPADATDRVTPSGPPALAETAGRRHALAFVGATWRMSSEGRSELEGRLGGQLDLTRTTTRLAALLSAGAAPEVDGSWAGGVATLRRLPLRLGLAIEIPAGPGVIEPALEGGPDLLLVGATANAAGAMAAESSHFVRFGAGVDASVAYRVAAAGPFCVRARAALGLAVVRYDVSVERQTDLVFRTPRGYSAFGIDAGLVFR
jgi:hypothetical protein